MPARSTAAPALPPDNPDRYDLLTVAEAAHRLRLSVSHTRELLNQGAIQTRYIGKRRLVLRSSLHAYVDNLPSTRG